MPRLTGSQRFSVENLKWTLVYICVPLPILRPTTTAEVQTMDPVGNFGIALQIPNANLCSMQREVAMLTRTLVPRNPSCIESTPDKLNTPQPNLFHQALDPDPFGLNGRRNLVFPLPRGGRILILHFVAGLWPPFRVKASRNNLWISKQLSSFPADSKMGPVRSFSPLASLP